MIGVVVHKWYVGTHNKQKTCVSPTFCFAISTQVAVVGGGGSEGIYGTVTQTGMHSILCAMRDNVTEEWAKLGHGSTFVDIGFGLGRPLLHAMVTIGVKATFGIECDKVKVRGW